MIPSDRVPKPGVQSKQTTPEEDRRWVSPRIGPRLEQEELTLIFWANGFEKEVSWHIRLILKPWWRLPFLDPHHFGPSYSIVRWKPTPANENG